MVNVEVIDTVDPGGGSMIHAERISQLSFPHEKSIASVDPGGGK